MRKHFWAVCVAVALASGQTVSADVWDLDTLNDEDDNFDTDNELVHGLVQVHDLAAEAGVVDEDWYFVASRPYSSYEVLVDGLTGNLYHNFLPVERLTGSYTVLGTSQGVSGLESARSLRWQVAGTGTNEFVRVTGSATSCTTACSTNDQYTIKFFETTGFIARFNNSGTQVTVLLLQNAAHYAISGTIYYFTAAGTLAGSSAFSVAANALSVVSTAATVPGASGSIKITHNGRYGDLNGKSVALEPSTGFSFDTPMVYKPK